jgi:hypothetical protein
LFVLHGLNPLLILHLATKELSHFKILFMSEIQFTTNIRNNTVLKQNTNKKFDVHLYIIYSNLQKLSWYVVKYANGIYPKYWYAKSVTACLHMGTKIT